MRRRYVLMALGILGAGSLLALMVAKVQDEDKTAAIISRKNQNAMPDQKHSDGPALLKTDEEWKRLLTPEQYYVTRQRGTERAFTGEYWNTKEKGIYRCVCCGAALFRSETKYDSGTGWPSFWQPIDEQLVKMTVERGLFMSRIEVLCRRCDAHLGHVFDDGPPPTGLRYCLNSAALKLDEALDD